MENTRVRMVEAGLRLFQKQGYAETSWRELVKEGGTPWGSVHHFFPGGKEELARDALALFSTRVEESFTQICAAHPRPADRIRTWFESMARQMDELGFTSGCPVAGIALNTVPMSASLAALCRETMTQWADLIARGIKDESIDSARAQALATTILVACEGALVLARVYQSSESLRTAGIALAAMLEPAASATTRKLWE